MPSFHSSALPRHMPLTPPDYYELSQGFARDARQVFAQSSLSQASQSINQDLGGSEMREVRSQYPWYNPTAVSGSSLSQQSFRHEASSHVALSQGPSNAYGRATAPLLPPMKVADHHLDEHPQHTLSNILDVTQRREEKATGGVAAHLDYEMQEMVDFVSETAQGMYDMYGSRICLADIDLSRSVIDSRTRVTPGFRKFVSQVLSSTRMPSSTILTGLHYFSTRMTLLSIEGNFQYGNGSLPHMLTTAFLLGSKFLDDNTFQNRSWSEVSNIPVGELNILEIEWLAAIKWNMHFHPEDPEGFLLWRRQWQRYGTNKANNVEPLVNSLEQIRLNKDALHSQQSFHRHLPPANDNLSYARSPVDNCFKDSSQWAAACYDSWPQLRNHMDYSPPSAPETGPTTPEWYDSGRVFGSSCAPYQMYSAVKMPASLRITGNNRPQSGHHTPYTQQYTPYPHGSFCSCGYCLSHHERFTMTQGYGPQPVVG